MIVVGTLLLLSFSTGVFASPPIQDTIVKVFVTNFPENQQVTVTNFPQNSDSDGDGVPDSLDAFPLNQLYHTILFNAQTVSGYTLPYLSTNTEDVILSVQGTARISVRYEAFGTTVDIKEVTTNEGDTFTLPYRVEGICPNCQQGVVIQGVLRSITDLEGRGATITITAVA